MTSSWLNTISKNDKAPLTLICFPYAGGSSQIFQQWRESVFPNISVYSVQLPGRPGNMNEVLNYDLQHVVTSITDALLPLLNQEYVFFGHSLGAKIAFEVATSLEKNENKPPSCFIASGSAAPSHINTRAPIHHLPDALFSEALKALGGTPDIILDNEELMTFFRPILRADFRLAETYQINNDKLGCQSYVLYGRDDSTVSLQGVKQWEQHFSQKTVFYEMDGGHFFIDEYPRHTISIINSVVETTLKNRTSTFSSQ